MDDALSHVEDAKIFGFDGFPCEFYKNVGSLLVDSLDLHKVCL